MSYMKGFSCISTDIVDDDAGIMSRTHLRLFQACEESDPDTISKEKIHISTRRTRTSKYLRVLCELYADRLSDNPRRYFGIFGKREHIDAIFSEFWLRSWSDLRNKFTRIERADNFLNECLYVLHVFEYRGKSKKRNKVIYVSNTVSIDFMISSVLCTEVSNTIEFAGKYMGFFIFLRNTHSSVTLMCVLFSSRALFTRSLNLSSRISSGQCNSIEMTL